MQQLPEHIERIRKKMFDRTKQARAWFKGLSTEQQKEAIEAWKKANPEDFRAGWDYKLLSVTHTVEDVWELSTGTKKDY